MKNSKTTKKKWELKMNEKEPLQCWIVNMKGKQEIRTDVKEENDDCYEDKD